MNILRRLRPKGLACHSPSHFVPRTLHRRLQSKAATHGNGHFVLQRTGRHLVQSNHVQHPIAEGIAPRPLCLRVGMSRRGNEDVQARLKRNEGEHWQRLKGNLIQLEEVQADRRYLRLQQAHQHPLRLQDLPTHHRKLALKVQDLSVSRLKLVTHHLLQGGV